MDNATRFISSIYYFWDKYFGDFNVTNFGPSVDQSLIATVAFLLASIIFFIIISKINSSLKNLREKPNFTFKIRELTIISSEELSDFLLLIFRFIRTITIFFLFICYLILITGFFPSTRNAATSVLRWLLSGLSSFGTFIVSCLPGMVAIILIAFITSQALKLLHLIMGAVERKRVALPGFHRDWANPTDKLISFLLIALAIVFGAPFLPGFDTPAFQGISVFLGVLLSLGSTAAIANVVAGVTLIYMRACRPGDRIKLGNIDGVVLETGLLVTRIQTIENQVITVPNGLVLSQPVINISTLAKRDGAGMTVNITLGYDLDWRKVHKLLQKAAKNTEGISSNPAPIVFQQELGDFSVAYKLQAYTQDALKLPHIHSNLRANVLDVFSEAKIEILSPTYEAKRDGSALALPKQEA